MDNVYSEEDINIFRDPARIIVAGFSNSGKTHLVTKLITKYSNSFSKIFISGVNYHPLQEDPILRFKLIVSKDIVDPLARIKPGDKVLLILDDIYLKAMQSQTVVDAFIKGRHSKLSVVMITQNLFMKGPYARDISLNTTHFILLQMRDLGQVECLARQIYGKKRAPDVVEIYKQAVLKRAFGYLLLDLSIKTPRELQFRSNIAGEPPCEVVYENGEFT